MAGCSTGSAVAVAKLGTLMSNRRTSDRADIETDNGILASVQGQYFAAALSQCPDARTPPSDTHRVQIDAGWVGRW